MSLDTFDNLKIAIINVSQRDDTKDDELNDFITLAETEMFQNPRKVLSVRSSETRATAVTLTTSRYLQLPDGFREMRRLRLDLDTGFRELTYRAPGHLRSIDGPTTPTFFTVTSQLEFDTVPDEAYTVEMQYLADFTPLSDTNQTNFVLTDSPNIYLFGALKELFSAAQDDEAAAKYEAKFINAIIGANKKYRKGKYGPAPRMRIIGQTP